LEINILPGIGDGHQQLGKIIGDGDVGAGELLVGLMSVAPVELTNAENSRLSRVGGLDGQHKIGESPAGQRARLKMTLLPRRWEPGWLARHFCIPPPAAERVLST